LDEIPFNANGKVDKNALKEPECLEQRQYIAPKNELQKKICTLFERVLELKRPIGIDEDFFFLGGDSIRAMELVSESRNILESLSFKQIYDGRTPEKIAELVLKNPQAAATTLGKILATGNEVALDTAFDMLAANIGLQKDTGFDESLAQNTIMNYASMMMGGHVGKNSAKICKKANGEIELKENGNVVRTYKNEQELLSDMINASKEQKVKTEPSLKSSDHTSRTSPRSVKAIHNEVDQIQQDIKDNEQHKFQNYFQSYILIIFQK
jgi:aryl carrier-like protein